jgi:hypothetical protein
MAWLLSSNVALFLAKLIFWAFVSMGSLMVNGWYPLVIYSYFGVCSIPNNEVTEYNYLWFKYFPFHVIIFSMDCDIICLSFIKGCHLLIVSIFILVMIHCWLLLIHLDCYNWQHNFYIKNSMAIIYLCWANKCSKMAIIILAQVCLHKVIVGLNIVKWTW